MNVYTAYNSIAIALGISILVTHQVMFGGSILISYLLAATVSCFLFMGIDKKLAKSVSTRIPEKIIFFIALAGGSAGMLAGMYFFRHKTKKSKFHLVLALILIIQIAIFRAINIRNHINDNHDVDVRLGDSNEGF